MKANLSSPGILVFCENYYPAWKTFVDGKPAAMLRAYYTLRAVPLQTGAHEVRFVYESSYFRLGAIISIATGIFLLGTLGVFIRGSLRREPKQG